MSSKIKKSTKVKTSRQNAEAAAAGSSKTASKKAAVLGTEKRSYRPLYVILTCAVLIAGGIYFVIRRSDAGTGYAPLVQAQLPANPAATEIKYPAALFEDGNARYYEYKGPDVTVRYFILKSSDGVIRAAFDACDVCWRSDKGYYQVGDEMICKNCGQRFPSVKVNEVKGGCNPSPLKRSIQGGNVVVSVADILAGSPYFNFSGRI